MYFITTLTLGTFTVADTLIIASILRVIARSNPCQQTRWQPHYYAPTQYFLSVCGRKRNETRL